MISSPLHCSRSPFPAKRTYLSFTVTPTLRLAVVIAAIGAVGLVAPFGVVSTLWIMAIAAAWLDGRLVRQTPTIERTVPALARNYPAPLRIRVVPSPSSLRARTITLRQPLPPDITVSPSTGSGDELNATITSRRRGVHALPNVAVRLEGPLGLMAVIHEIASPLAVTVHPDLPTAHRLAMSARRGTLQTEGRSRGPLGIGTEFEAVREYRPDDDVRQINWLATARTGRAMSTVYRQEDDRDLLIAVDTGRLTAGSFAGLDADDERSSALAATTRLDVLFDAVTALALVADEIGDRVGFLAYDSEERVRLRPQRRGGEGVVNAALSLEPRPVDTDHGLLAQRLPSARRSIVVVVVDLLDEANAGSLVSSIARLEATHDVVVAAPFDPAIDAAINNAEDPALRDAAADFLADRTALVRRLEATGAQVVSADPQRIAAAATRAYVSRRSGARPRRQTRAQ